MVGIISPMITGIIIILVLTITIMLIIWKGVSNIYKLTQPKQLGGSCVVPTDCAGANLDVFSPGVQQSLRCLSRVSRKQHEKRSRSLPGF